MSVNSIVSVVMKNFPCALYLHQEFTVEHRDYFHLLLAHTLDPWSRVLGNVLEETPTVKMAAVVSWILYILLWLFCLVALFLNRKRPTYKFSFKRWHVPGVTFLKGKLWAQWTLEKSYGFNSFHWKIAVPMCVSVCVLVGACICTLRGWGVKWGSL